MALSLLAIKNEWKSLPQLHSNDCECPCTLACNELTARLRERERERESLITLFSSKRKKIEKNCGFLVLEKINKENVREKWHKKFGLGL